MNRWLLLLVSVAIAICVPGCKNKLSGTVSVNGKSFALESCRSGQAYGFHGVELTAKSGDRLRLVQGPGGDGLVYYFPSGKTVGTSLGKCGPLTVTRQNSSINKITNVEGSARLKCESGGVKIDGNVAFANCH